MKIKELIEELKRLDPEGRAFIEVHDHNDVPLRRMAFGVKSERCGLDAIIVADD